MSKNPGGALNELWLGRNIGAGYTTGVAGGWLGIGGAWSICSCACWKRPMGRIGLVCPPDPWVEVVVGGPRGIRVWVSRNGCIVKTEPRAGGSRSRWGSVRTRLAALIECWMLSLSVLLRVGTAYR